MNGKRECQDQTRAVNHGATKEIHVAHYVPKTKGLKHKINGLLEQVHKQSTL